MILQSAEPKAAREVTNRVVNILDAKYEKADLEKVINDATSLNKDEKKKLLKLLQQFEELFDGTLGTWDTEP
eukprot:1571835-Ditylum_brightwellii.AAC.1